MSPPLVVIVLLVAMLGACMPSASRRTAPLPSSSTPVVTGANMAGPWVLAAPMVSQQLTITTRALVTIAGDSGTRVDTLQAILGASFVWASRAQERLNGLLNDYRIAVGGAALGLPPGLQLPKPFSAQRLAVGRSLAFTLPPESAACTDPASSALQGLHDALIRLPDTLAVGFEWADTVQTLSCRDRIPLRGTNVRRFQVKRGMIEEGARMLVLIERTSSGRLHGQGEQFGEPVLLEGVSSGALTYTVDPLIGRVLRAVGKSSLGLSLRSSRRNQSVTQESSLMLVWEK